MTIQEGLTTEDNVRLRLQELEALDEKRLEAQQALECYQARMSKAFDKHVKPRSFQVGELVLAVRRALSRRDIRGISLHLNGTDPTSSKKFSQMEHTKSLVKIDYKLAQSTANFSKLYA